MAHNSWAPGTTIADQSDSAVKALQSQQGSATITITDIEVNCKTQMVVYEDGEPDDLVALMALFSRATKTYTEQKCKEDEYPIKAVFGGGGYNAQMSHKMLISYLEQLRNIGIIPRSKEVFNLERRVYRGPTSADQNEVQFDNFGLAFDKDFTRRNYAAQDALQSTMDAVPSQEVLAGLTNPIIVALRPIPEHVVCYVQVAKATQGVNIPTNTTYDEMVRSLLWSPGFSSGTDGAVGCGKIVAKIAESKVVMYQGAHNFKQLGRFFRKSISPNTVSEGEASQQMKAIEKVFVENPQIFLLIDRFVMLSTADMKHRQSKNLFSQSTQKEVFAQLVKKEQLSKTLLSFINHWNSGILQWFTDKVNNAFRSSWTAKTAEVDAIFEHLGRKAPGVAAEAVRGRPHDLKIWRGMFQRLMSLLPQLGLNEATLKQLETSLDIWQKIAPEVNSQVVPADILVPFCFEPGANTVKSSLERVQYEGQNEWGFYTWPSPTNASGAGNVWLTNWSPTPEVAETRERAVTDELGHLYLDVLGGHLSAAAEGELRHR
ncbi:MAG: hypothetical protein M1832_002262 [Thelocarpon impressellum]|nr:MAG: hypothetical protein M1832_002262 [Thelocarpon impressellum]